MATHMGFPGAQKGEVPFREGGALAVCGVCEVLTQLVRVKLQAFHICGKALLLGTSKPWLAWDVVSSRCHTSAWVDCYFDVANPSSYYL
jgi:hypothetical protein